MLHRHPTTTSCCSTRAPVTPRGSSRRALTVTPSSWSGRSLAPGEGGARGRPGPVHGGVPAPVTRTLRRLSPRATRTPHRLQRARTSTPSSRPPGHTHAVPARVRPSLVGLRPLRRRPRPSRLPPPPPRPPTRLPPAAAPPRALRARTAPRPGAGASPGQARLAPRRGSMLNGGTCHCTLIVVSRRPESARIVMPVTRLPPLLEST